MTISMREQEISGFRECGSCLNIWPLGVHELVNFSSSFRVLLKGIFSNHGLKYGLESIFWEVLKIL
jgi:hypothetical protein